MEPRQQEKGSWEGFKPVRTQRPTASAGWGTRLLAAILTGAIGAGLAGFLAMNALGRSDLRIRNRRDAVYNEPTQTNSVFIGVLGVGFVMGAMIPIFAWPKLKDHEPLE